LEEFDVIIIGSSPLSLLEAALLKRSGKSVCVIDRNDRLGGAWLTEDALTLQGIETTPHLFVPEQSAYKALDELLDGQFQELPQQPHLLVSRTSFPFKKSLIPMSQQIRVALAMFFAEHIDSKKKRLHRRVIRGVKFLYRQIYYNKLLVNCGQAKYPRFGLSKWFERIAVIFEREQITLKLQKRVMSIETHAKKCRVAIEGGTSLVAGRVILSRHSDLKFFVNGVGLDLIEPKRRYSNHLTFVVKNSRPMPFIHAIGNTKLMLFNDITDTAEQMNLSFPDCRLITMRTNATDEPIEIDHESSFQELKRLGLLSAEAEMLSHHERQICTSTLSRQSVETIRTQFSGTVDFLLTDDLGIMSSISNRCSELSLKNINVPEFSG
jgi:NAD(P)-binding Rossmann-like domain